MANQLRSSFTFGCLLCSLVLCAVTAEFTEPCQNYANCLQILEDKQRECRDSAAQKRHSRELAEDDAEDDVEDETKCSKRRNQKLHEELTGLHLRKTEKIGDCIKKNLEKAEESVPEETNKKCRHAFEKLIKTLDHKSNKKLRKRGNKKQRKLSEKKADLRCRKERKMLHKKCTKISVCCSTAQLCSNKSSAFTDQILELKTSLKQNRDLCKPE